MPQVIVKGISREKTAALGSRIAETVASIIAVPEEWIVVEHNEVAFFRGRQGRCPVRYGGDPVETASQGAPGKGCQSSG